MKAYRAERSWGNEYLIAIVPNYYSVKILEIFSGHKGGLQSHFKKNECGFVIDGSLLVRKVEGSRIVETVLSRGSFFHFEPGTIHQEEALEKVIILEVSTPHFNDRKRYDHCDSDTNSLPSTSYNEVIMVSSSNDLAILSTLGFSQIDIAAVPSISVITG